MAMIEVLIGILILSFGLIPIYTIFTSSKTVAFKSEVSYLALHAARDRLDELQLLPVSALLKLASSPESDWTPVEGNAFAVLINLTEGQVDPAPMANGGVQNRVTALGTEAYNYPKAYARIMLKTKVEVLPVFPADGGNEASLKGPPWLFKVDVKVRWQEKGEDLNEQESEGTKLFKSHFERIFSVGGFGEGDKR
jgi:hypothetical protein